MNPEDNISITSGKMRELSSSEKLVHQPYKYVTEEDHHLYMNNLSITVPAGFLTDGSSGGPDYGRSWLFHDWLYCTHSFNDGIPCTRQEADRVMHSVLHHEQIHCYCRAFVTAAKINPFWLFSKAWRNSGVRGPEFMNRDALGILMK